MKIDLFGKCDMLPTEQQHHFHVLFDFNLETRASIDLGTEDISIWIQHAADMATNAVLPQSCQDQYIL